jgi:hypothetical protein
MFQFECWTWKDFLGRCSEYDMLLDQQVTEGSISGKVAEKMRTGNEVDYSSLKVFGCLAYVHIPSEE